MMRLFTLVGIALAAASMQLRARADTVPGTEAVQQATGLVGSIGTVTHTVWRSN
jgi:hypothetical protein